MRGAAAQREKLRALGIEHRFAGIVISGDVGVAKPDPAAFATALEALGVVPEGVWHVGDNPEADVAGARAGLTSVWLNRTGRPRSEREPAPDIEIRSLSEPTPLLP